MPRSPKHQAETISRVRSLLATRELSLAELSRQSCNRFPEERLFRIPFNFYDFLRRPSFSPSLHQIYALSVLTDYALADWLSLFGFSFDDAAIFQASRRRYRTAELDARLYDSSVEVSWFEEAGTPVLGTTLTPLSRWLRGRSKRSLHSLSNKIGVSFRYFKIGAHDAYAFPDLLPASIVRVDVRAPSTGAPTQDRTSPILAIESQSGIICGRIRRLSGDRIVLCSRQLAYEPAEFRLGTEARIAMHRMPELSPETRRVVLVCPPRCEFFLERCPRGVSLPEVSVPGGQRISVHLNSAAKSRWNLSVVSIGEVEVKKSANRDGSAKYEILEVLQGAEALSTELSLVPASTLAMAPLVRPDDRAVLEQIALHPESLPLCGHPGPFSHFGWFEEVRHWAQENLSRCGQRLTGRFRQLTAGASFSLVRFETEGDAVWWKAVGDRNVREYAVTAALASAAPQFMPEILACRPEWHAWLSREAAGMALSGSEDVRKWQAAAYQLAQLQIALLPHTKSLLSAGAQDVRVPFLRSQIDHFFEVLEHLMGKQTKAHPAPLTSHEIYSMQQSLPGFLDRWEHLGIPDALDHLDLNPENVLATDDRCVFLDWAETAVGPPFLTLQYFLEHLGQAFPRPCEAHQAVTTAYMDPWKALVPEREREAAIPLLPAITVYACTTAAIAGRDLEFLEQPKVAASVRSMGRRLRHELKAIGQSAAAD